MGLPLSKLYLQAMGGDLEFFSLEGYGTTAYAKFSRFGNVELL